MPRLDVDIDYLAEQLRGLLKIPSPTGFTDTITHAVVDELIRLGVEPEVTRRGAIRAKLKGRARTPLAR